MSTPAELVPTAINFFTSVRVPAAFVTGSSLAACFSLSSRMEEAGKASSSELEKAVLLVYHGLALMSFLLSVNVVITSTATANMLLLTKGTNVEVGQQTFGTVYEFLKEFYLYEFTLVRWSFYVGLLSFLACFGLRVMLEFDLLKKERRLPALAVGLAIASLFFDLISFINQRIYTWTNLATMTVELTFMHFRRLRTPQVMEILSLSCMIGSLGTLAALIRTKMSTLKEKSS